MTALRQLSVVYVAAAGAYAIAMAMSAHPNWVREADQTAAYLRTHTVATAATFDDHVLRPDMKMAEAAGDALERSVVAAFRSDTVKVAHRDLSQPLKIARVLPGQTSCVRADGNAVVARADRPRAAAIRAIA